MDNNDFTELQSLDKQVKSLLKNEENKLKNWALLELKSLYNKMQQASQNHDFDTFTNEYMKYIQLKMILHNM